jgi:GDP-4-dehydro-6-deoxy-D-mannose reductase
MTTWLITGAHGFLGRHVMSAARNLGHAAIGLDRVEIPTAGDSHHHRVDLESGDGLDQALARINPDVIVHAAGRTPPASTRDFYRANVLTTTRLLEAVARRERPPRVVLVGSAAEIGPLPESLLPVSESCPCRPIDSYGLSKWAATQLGLSVPPPLQVVVGRIFNLTGPGLPTGQAFGRFAHELAQARMAGATSPISLHAGGLDTRRDFIDVRDAADALIALGLRGRPGTLYHIASGQSHAIADGLEILAALSGLQVQTSLRPHPRAGAADSRAEITRIYQHTAWRPKISLQTSLTDLWTEALRHARLTHTGPRRVA